MFWLRRHSKYCDRHSRKPWAKFINVDNHHLAVPEVVCIVIIHLNVLYYHCFSFHIYTIFLKGCWLCWQVITLWSPRTSHCKRSHGKSSIFFSIGKSLPCRRLPCYSMVPNFLWCLLSYPTFSWILILYLMP